MILSFALATWRYVKRHTDDENLRDRIDAIFVVAASYRGPLAPYLSANLPKPVFYEAIAAYERWQRSNRAIAFGRR